MTHEHAGKKILAEIVAGLEGVTPGPWYRENEENEGSYGSGPNVSEGYTSFKLCADEGDICSAYDSDLAVIEEEVSGDEDGTWIDVVDIVSAANMDHLSRCSPDNIREIDAFVKSQSDRIAALEVEAQRDLLKRLMNAWDALPKGNNSVRETQKWIVDDLAPVFLELRTALQSEEDREDG